MSSSISFSLIVLWISIFIAVVLILTTVGMNIAEQSETSNALAEIESAQETLEAAARSVIEKANKLRGEGKMMELEKRYLKLKQAERDIESASDVTQLDEARNLAATVHDRIDEVRKMIQDFKEFHKK